MPNATKTQLLVIGSGPGGYSAAFRAADLGLEVTLVEQYPTLGGVCLNVGCIPSKALLHAAKVLEETHEMANFGLKFGEPEIDTTKLRDWKNKIVGRLTGGLKMLAKQRKVTVVQGVAKFVSDHEVSITGESEVKSIQFENVIIAAGSRPIELPFLPKDPRIMDSTGALELEQTQSKMLVIGGGIIGLEMATVYEALGAEITVVELMDQIIPGCDLDAVTPLFKRIQKRYKSIMLKTKVTKVEAQKDGLMVTFETEEGTKQELFDRILSSVGRRPNSDRLDLAKTSVKVDERGFITVDKQMRTKVPHIYAIGDIVGQPMLAHKGMAEGRVAAEVLSGLKHFFDPRCIPSVAYTDPEVAWVGMTENEAKKQGVAYGKSVFPWAASGRSLAMARDEGMTKLIVDEKTHRILGAAITGPNAGELIAEVTLAIEMGCEVEDVALTIHPHPTLSESVGLSAEIFEGTITDLYMPKKAKV